MFGLIPKEEKFFVMFRDMAEKIVSGAEALQNFLDDFHSPHKNQQIIKELEHQGDLQTHEIIKKLDKSFITPFDREDIYELAAALDDILDVIDIATQHIVIYHIEYITEEAKELGRIILKACQAVEQAVIILDKNSKQIFEFCTIINTLENEADSVRTAAISRLFDNEKNPITLIKWKDIYENLELITDKCEDAANIIESVVLKNA